MVAAKHNAEHAKFIRFVVSSGVAAVVNIVVRLLLQFVMGYELAVFLAYLVGMSVAFVLARLYVFDGRSRRADGQFLRFAAVNAIAFAQVWLVSVGLARYAFPAIGFHWHAETVAHIIGVGSPVVSSYLGHRHFSFRA
jgi:putative flippase GtrA